MTTTSFDPIAVWHFNRPTSLATQKTEQTRKTRSQNQARPNH